MTEFQQLILSKIDALKATHLVVERADLDTLTADLCARLDALQRQVAALQQAVTDRRSDVRERAAAPAPAPPPADTSAPIGRAASRASSGHLIDVKEVVRRVGLGRTTVDKLIREGKFPPRVKIGFLTRWSAAAVDAWIQERIAGSPGPGL